MSEYIELSWSVMGDRLRADHNYRLYSALIEKNGNLKQIDYRMNTIEGAPDAPGWIKLGRESRLLVRCKYADMAEFSALDNAVIRIGQNIIQLGEGEGSSIAAKDKLFARLVTIKADYRYHISPFEFGVALGKQLQTLGVANFPALGRRKALRIKESDVVGYSLSFDCLRPQESIILQSIGVGGRGKIGCGVFV